MRRGSHNQDKAATIALRSNCSVSGRLSCVNYIITLIWWIAALLRLANFPYLSIPVISNRSFSEIAQSDQEPTLTPFETEGRIFGPAEGSVGVLNIEHVEWVKREVGCRGTTLESESKVLHSSEGL